jgi:putative DNA primase/helicase
MTHAEYMPRVVRGWLNALHGQSQGWIFIGSTANTDAGTRWMNGDVFETTPEGLDRAARYVDQLDQRGRSGIYVRVTTLREQPARGPDGEATRGAASDSLSLPGLAADIDIAGPGHKHDPDRHGGLTLPPDELVARLIVDTSGLPTPTVWQRTGGGMYPWWILDQPVELLAGDAETTCLDVTVPRAEEISTRLGQVIAQAARRLGFHYGTGVHDLARVLRIPGTINRKDGLARQSTLIKQDAPGRRYEWRELADAILSVPLEPVARAIPTGSVGNTPRRDPVAAARPGLSPLDAFEESATIGDLLEPLGWTFVRMEGDAQLWRRPGATSEYSAKFGKGGVPTLVVHSDNAGLPAGAGQRLTLAKVAAHLHYAGSTSALARDLVAYAGGNPGATLPHIGNLPAIAEHIRRSCGITPHQEGGGTPTRDDLEELAGGNAGTMPDRSRKDAPPASPDDATPPAENPPAKGAGPTAVDGKTSGDPEPLAEFSDARLAETIAARVFNGRYIWTAGLGWFRWDGCRWQECDLVDAVEAVRRFVLDWATREIRTKKATAGSDRVKALLGLLSGSRINGITALARGIIVRDAADMDADPDILNTPDGVVDLRTGQLLPHDPAYLCTKVTAVAYEPGAEHADWKQALEALRPDVVDWMQLRLGQAITGHMPPDDVLLILQGGGENGKSTLMGTVAAVIGDYYRLISDRVLLANPDSHPTELMDLRGARLAWIEETPEARKLDVGRLKKVVGTAEITARHIRKDSVTFRSSHSLFVSTNYRPLVTETDHGTWRRLRLVTFPFRYVRREEDMYGPDDRIGDPTLRERLRLDIGSEAQRAVLAWLVEGAERWYRNGRTMPDAPLSVVEDTRAWRVESDLILAYIGERIAFDLGAHVMSSELLADFNQWLELHGQRAWSDKTFAARFGDHEETSSHRVTKSRIRSREGLSRSPNIERGWRSMELTQHVPAEVPAQYVSWLGISFARDDDQGSDEGK